MPKAIRYRDNGTFLQNSMFWTPGDFIGAASEDPERAAIEEAITLASHKQDFATAFGIPADEIECVEIPYNGDPKTLPYDDDAHPDKNHVRIPEEQRDGYVEPAPAPPTLEEKVNALLAVNPQAMSALGITAEKIG